MSEVSPTPAQIVFIREAVDDLAAYLELWGARRPLPESSPAARAAAGVAVERIDTTLRRLIVLRSELVAEIRAEDAAWLALDDDQPEG